ncbi:MAG: hypothetical protein WC476_00005, partial [Phycisphaerae bacterium]
MSKRFLFLISFVLVVVLTAISYGQDAYIIGNWEDVNDGWDINDVNATVTYSTTGATLDSKSLKVDVSAGYNIVMAYDLMGEVAEFQDNSLFQIDILRQEVNDVTPYEWDGPGSVPTEQACTTPGGAYSQFFTVIEVNDGNGSQYIQLYETGEWSLEGDPCYNIPFLFTYDYGTALAKAPNAIDFNTLVSLNIFLITNWGNYSGGAGVYYLDNAKLTVPAQTTTIGDFESVDLDGWKIAAGVSGVTIAQEYTNGITLGSKSLKITAGTGWTNGIVLDLVARPGGFVDKFKRGEMFSADITRLTADWTGTSDYGRFSQLRLVINAGGTGWGFWKNMMTSRTSWPPNEDYPGDADDPIKCYFEYRAYTPYIDFEDVTYLQLNFATNRGTCWDTGGVYYLDNVQLHAVPAVTASNPQPVHTAEDVTLNTTLSWDPGLLAQGHNVWFGNSEANMVLVSPDQDPCTYDPCDVCSPYAGLLLPDTNYYWRIDEVNENDATVWTGEVWRFKTGKGLNVDDFDSYNVVNGNDELDDLWVVYDSTAVVSLDTATVHSSKSMKYSHQNYIYPYFAEAEVNTLDLPSGIGSDWTLGNSKALTLYFYGKTSNDANELMYVTLYDADSNATVMYDGDADAVRELYWHQWNIDLADFVGVDTDNVTKMTIGFGDGVDPVAPTYEASVVYFDDIRLYVPRCVPGKTTADVNGDCYVDYTDLGILTDYWLLPISTTAPSEANLVGKWMLDADACDTSGYNNNGTLGSGASNKPDWYQADI